MLVTGYFNVSDLCVFSLFKKVFISFITVLADSMGNRQCLMIFLWGVLLFLMTISHE